MSDDQMVYDFQETVWDFYRQHARHDLPWRQPEADGSFSAYKVMVSEIMLQQTQVARVIPKYQQFLNRFPDVFSLAAAPLGEVLRVWSGLGYNRRAKFLQQAAQAISQEYGGTFPTSQTELTKLPGIGHNTAGAILAYAFNQPVVFIETNIRTVFIHHFFNDQTAIADKDIVALATQTLDTEHVRVWYWALMDYGSYLKQVVGNLNRHSKSYGRQSAFHGSRRQLRGLLIRLLSERPWKLAELTTYLNDERLEDVVEDLLKEQLIRRHKGQLSL